MKRFFIPLVLFLCVGSLFAVSSLKGKSVVQKSVFSNKMSVLDMSQNTDLETLLTPFYQLSTMPLLDLQSNYVQTVNLVNYYNVSASDQNVFEFVALLTSAFITGLHPQSYENISRNKQVLKEYKIDVQGLHSGF